MAKSKNTRSALLCSVLATVLCAAMLVGTTFAWFTDSVTSGKNQIVAGNLDVKLSYQNAAGSDFAEVAPDTEDLFVAEDGSEILWEPGAAAVTYLKLENAGSLALKYALSAVAEDVVVGSDGAALSKVLKTAVVEIEEAAVGTYTREAAAAAAEAADAQSVLDYCKTGEMAADAAPLYLAMIVYFPEEVGNEVDGAVYNRSDVQLETDLSLTLVATQAVYEADSFDNTYDTDATYLNTDAEGNILIGTADELVYFAKTVNVDKNNYKGQTVKLTADIDLGGRVWTPVGNVSAYPGVTFAGIFDGGNYTIRNMHAVSSEPVYAAAGFFGSITGVVQNVNFTNATVESTHYAGVVVGYSSANVGMKIENCHVDGATVTTKPELLANGSYDNGDKAGGIIGYCVAGDVVTGCSVENATITGYRDIGGIVGCAAGTITNNSVADVTLVQDTTNGYQATVPETIGEVIGRRMEGLSESGNSVDTVSIQRKLTVSKDLESALEAIVPGEKVEISLEEDVPDAPGIVTESGTDLTVDLGGSTMTVVSSVGSSGTETNGMQLLAGSTVALKDGVYKPGNGNVLILIQNYSNLTLEDVTLDARGSAVDYALSNNCGYTVITGDTNIYARDGGVALDACKFSSYEIPTVVIDENMTGTITGTIEMSGGNLIIAGGTINGKIDTTTYGIGGGSLVIKGGTFQNTGMDFETFQSYVAAGYVAENNDGVYTVHAAG